MTPRPDQQSPRTDRLALSAERHVRKQFEKGEDVFPVHTIMAALALNILMVGDERIEAEAAINAAAIEELRRQGAEGQVYAVREDLGSGLEDSEDRVIVTSRNGQPTRAHYQPEIIQGRAVIIRASTQPPKDVA